MLVSILRTSCLLVGGIFLWPALCLVVMLPLFLIGELLKPLLLVLAPLALLWLVCRPLPRS
jgi:hypothetical protein